MANWFCYLVDTDTEDLAVWWDDDGFQVRVEQNLKGLIGSGARSRFIRMTLPIETAHRLRDWLNETFPAEG
jgi:hypothetical protein